MFGGLAFMIDGQHGLRDRRDELMLRLGAEGADRLSSDPRVRQMDFTGRPMTGMVYVERDGLGDSELRTWVEQAVAFARSLPPKQPK